MLVSKIKAYTSTNSNPSYSEQIAAAKLEESVVNGSLFPYTLSSSAHGLIDCMYVDYLRKRVSKSKY